MGVPKFFRYISERYPCLSEFVKEYQIPEFDNLYLDMNGIIHNCSHPDDGDPHFRITEEKIFADIFHYIEVLFRMIRPQRLFFMAIDGVAPRAKMNQQRGRRFRSAKDAEKLEEKAKERGEVLPEASRFDSNCITPGTVFMAKLHEQLKYFIVNKITNDKLWKGCKIILSGHETPGEGEHKIMDYIRYLRAQPGYDANTRHCLYGLDADLIMLGLCTHEPHFSLLREEVMFGKKSTKRKSAPEQISFFLLHLSLMREYLEMEFSSLREVLPFKYDMDSIIDDWVLMSFLVGNDFIPNLPNMHIANGALPMLYNAYMQVLPTFDGYINEGGHLHLDRFEKFMAALECIDMDNFSEQYADLKYFEAKTGRRPNDKERTSYKPKKLEEWKGDETDDLMTFVSLEPEKPMRSDLAALIKATEDMFLEPSEENLEKLEAEDQDDEDLLEDVASESGTDSSSNDLMDAEFLQHKKDYYMNKLDYDQVTPAVLRDQAECYVRAIQWNLNYYYNGVCSWGWYYPHHYAPFISDIKGFQNLDFNFELGKPFQPYEQLLGVLPAASKSLLPECYHWLMTDENSPIKSYYPVDFATDLNGKKQDWEAVVLIPFIDEKLLLDAMNTCNKHLTEVEVKRNTHGPMLLYEYTENDNGDYEAPEYFPKIKNHHAYLTRIDIKDIRVPIDKLVKGAYPGMKADIYYPGFPTTKHLQYTSSLQKAKVKVFDQPSRGENMIIQLEPCKEEPIETLAKQLLGTTVFVAWPHLVEAMVVSITTKNYRYHKTSNPGEYNVEENQGNIAQNWEVERSGIIGYYRDRLGIEVGETKILINTRPMIGRKYIFTPQGRVNLEKQWAQATAVYPLQTIVQNIETYNKEYTAYKDIGDVFKVGSYCFMLGQPHYGQMGTILECRDSLEKGRVKMSVVVSDEPNLDSVQQMAARIRVNYMPSKVVASKLRISTHLLTRVTGTLLVILGPKRPGGIQEDASKINIGLNLKYNKKNEEIPGYTRREKTWLYSQKVVQLTQEYLDLYPSLFDKLCQIRNNDIFYEYELFPEDEGTGKTIKEIADWLKKQPYNSIERQACGSEVLDPDVVKELENVVDKHLENQTSKVVKMQVKPHLLYKSYIQMGNIEPDQNSTYYLYDRVVNVRESYTVPVGSVGTVIAIHKPVSGKPEDIVYDVVFDKEFAGGLPLNCSPNKGYRMSKLSLINRSHGLRQLEEKTGRPGQLLQQSSIQKQQQQQPYQQYSQNNQPHVYHQNNQPQPYRQNNPSQTFFPNNQPQPYQQNSPGNYGMYQPQNSAFASWNMQNQFRQYYSPPAHSMPMPIPMAMPMRPPNMHPNNRSFEPKSPQSYQGKTRPNIDFMPSFGGNATQGSTEGVQSKEDNKDTDMLKKLLKIDGSPAAAAEGSQNKKKVPEKQGMQVSLNDMFAHAKAQNKNIPPLPKPSTNAPFVYSLELSAYYQTRGFGCPQYKYFDCPDGKNCTAQLIMPFSKETVFGEPAPNRDQACELVAKVVLEKLKNSDNKEESANVAIPVKFPTPPKQWCQTENRKPKKHTSPQKQVKQNGSGNEAAKEKQDKRKTSESASVPFVPLQAVRSQRNSKSGNANDTPPNKRNAQDKQKADSKMEEIPVKDDSGKKTGAPENKPRRERKMRIAANFSAAKNTS